MHHIIYLRGYFCALEGGSLGSSSSLRGIHPHGALTWADKVSWIHQGVESVEAYAAHTRTVVFKEGEIIDVEFLYSVDDHYHQVFLEEKARGVCVVRV